VTIILSTGPERELVLMPNLVGKKLEAAREALSQMGLTVKDVRYAFSTAYLPNRVTQQEPKAGEEVKRGSGVRLVVSKL
jgi:serine/threonine-protein kinase